MPASSINFYNMQDAKTNFEAMRPAPVCTDTSMLTGHCQNIHISKNCYYGYHDTKSLENDRDREDPDCEMVEVSHAGDTKATSSPLSNTRKRSADHDTYYPLTKRLRQDDSSICSLVGTRSSPSHSASAFNVNISKCYFPLLFVSFRIKFCIRLYIT